MPDELKGLLCIGDPHLCSRVPGFRRDDYPQAILNKLCWSLQYARDHALLPLLLGDLFHVPRDNANWLLVDLIAVLPAQTLAIAGNHDCAENALSEHDTLSVLIAAGRIRLLDDAPWTGTINHTSVAIGGSTWRKELPSRIDRAALNHPKFVFWLTHHDLRFAGYEESAYLGCREIPGLDLVINGHIHRCLPDVVCGTTTWCNPGNIARVNRSDASRTHVPGLLRIDISPDGWSKSRIAVPHEPFDAVFHPELQEQSIETSQSLFITGLTALQKFKTAGGEGLTEFLSRNLQQFPAAVQDEILNLSKEVLTHG